MNNILDVKEKIVLLEHQEINTKTKLSLFKKYSDTTCTFSTFVLLELLDCIFRIVLLEHQEINTKTKLSLFKKYSDTTCL